MQDRLLGSKDTVACYCIGSQTKVLQPFNYSLGTVPTKIHHCSTCYYLVKVKGI